MVSARAGWGSLAGNVSLLPFVFVYMQHTCTPRRNPLKSNRLEYVFMGDVQADVRFPYEFMEDFQEDVRFAYEFVEDSDVIKRTKPLLWFF